jgi:ribosome-associated heat shock protein Hsp15
VVDAALTIRLDKWLYYARFFKTRSIAAKVVTGGHVRVNSARVSKAAHAVSVGDTLTFPQGDRIRVARILDPGSRRGPAPEAQALYDDLSPPPDPKQPAAEQGRVGGRPTKKDRRNLPKRGGYGLE